MKTMIQQLIDRVSTIKSLLDISILQQELKRLREDYFDKLLIWGENHCDNSWNAHQKASLSLGTFRDQYGELLTIFPPLEETLEELEVFNKEFTNQEKATRLAEVEKAMNILEVYEYRIKQGLPIEAFFMQHCEAGYEEIDKFFQKNFGIPLPARIKAGEPIFTYERAYWWPKLCDDFHTCKKQRVCPHLGNTSFLFSKDAYFTRGKSSYFNSSKEEAFFETPIPSFYFLGYAPNDDFYYLRADDWRKYYLRFWTGGTVRWEGWEERRIAWSNFLPAFLQFEELVEGKVDALQLKNHNTTVSIIVKKGETIVRKSLHIGFEKNFSTFFENIVEELGIQ